MADEKPKTQKSRMSSAKIAAIVFGVILFLVIIGFVIFIARDNKVGKPGVRNTSLSYSNRLPLLGANGSPLNSASISSGGGYGGKFNSY